MNESDHLLALFEAMAQSTGGANLAADSHIRDRLSDIADRTLSDPEFRVLTAKGQRKGVRLEPVFWQALDLVAAELSTPRNALALAIMELGGKEHVNTTSLLRSFLVSYLLSTRAARPLSESDKPL